MSYLTDGTAFCHVNKVLHLLNVLDKWTEALDNGSHVDVIYFDFMIVFDIVPHQRLLRALRFIVLQKTLLN